MKPTPEQVVSHFGLPAEAVESHDIQCAIDRYSDEMYEDCDDAMDLVSYGFLIIFDCPITDYFKPKAKKRSESSIVATCYYVFSFPQDRKVE